MNILLSDIRIIKLFLYERPIETTSPFFKVIFVFLIEAMWFILIIKDLCIRTNLLFGSNSSNLFRVFAVNLHMSLCQTFTFVHLQLAATDYSSGLSSPRAPRVTAISQHNSIPRHED